MGRASLFTNSLAGRVGYPCGCAAWFCRSPLLSVVALSRCTDHPFDFQKKRLDRSSVGIGPPTPPSKTDLRRTQAGEGRAAVRAVTLNGTAGRLANGEGPPGE